MGDHLNNWNSKVIRARDKTRVTLSSKDVNDSTSLGCAFSNKECDSRNIQFSLFDSKVEFAD